MQTFCVWQGCWQQQQQPTWVSEQALEKDRCTSIVFESCQCTGLIESDWRCAVSQQACNWQTHKKMVQLIWNTYGRVNLSQLSCLRLSAIDGSGIIRIWTLRTIGQTLFCSSTWESMKTFFLMVGTISNLCAKKCSQSGTGTWTWF